ncbi:alpha/beta hydrolase family protein [Streptomonospora nanhaiensis]|uniref:Acetyl esterase/lipase n=1 Tax=Streptomonospora nanhaiensis TaxID=1323731 RepID=A0A853BJ71_9ACTN|nr:alpha/beta hydrolase [Streptomonospora nanhaiensis]MBV2364662.1 alpha/beta hydrolase [Streptomonospora nanhaiensis]MBX9390137.1 alpha/beta hydrolase [Streptomonospora nanhaiensis]NYI94647.1 acetyl esterase/lipase [Streptomonospora nanhaiensis]
MGNASTGPARHSRHVFDYGGHAGQVVHIHQPAADDDAPFPVAVLLHGGWWRAAHDTRLMEPVAAHLADRGWLVWNVEYRRTGGDGGGWPQTLEDVQAALALLGARLAEGAEPGDPATVVAVGHSAGGHLALMAAPGSPLTGVVALAPVTDLRAAADRGLGEGAVAEFLAPAHPPEPAGPGGEPTGPAGEERPAPADPESASPLHRLPLGTPQLVVHGAADRRVPVAQSRAYVEAARAAGDAVDYVEPPEADHFAVIDPAHPAWTPVRAWLDRARA